MAYYGRGIWWWFNNRDVFIWAQAIAFKVLIAVLPIVILATGVLGQILRYDKPFESVAGFIQGFMPAYQSDQFIGFLEKLQGASSTFTIIGSVGLFITAVTLFTTLRVVLANVFVEEWDEHRTLLRGYAFDVRMIAQVGVFFLLSLGLSILVQTVNASGLAMLQEAGMDRPWIQQGWGRVFRYVGLALPFLLSIFMFFQLFYFVPKHRPAKRSALTGAVVTALLWDVAKVLFTYYAAHIGQFDRYRGNAADDGLAVLGDTFGLVIALVFWAYYSGIVLIIGAIVALLRESRHRARLLAKAAAAARPHLPLQDQTIAQSSEEPVVAE